MPLKFAEIAGTPSMQDRIEKVQCAVNKLSEGDGCGCWCYVSDLTEADAIVNKAGEYLRYPYTITAEGEVELGAPVAVKLSWQDAGADDTRTASDGSRGTHAFVTDLRGLQFNEAGPVKLEVCTDGSWQHPTYGTIEVTPAMRESFVRNFNANVRKVGDLPLDYDHEDGPAPGWITNLYNEGASLFSDVQMTPSGREKVRSGEYRFFSPEWSPNWRDPETGENHGPTLFGGGLTNKPFFRGMAAIQCSERRQGARPTGPGVGQGERPMPTGQEHEETLTAAELRDRLTAKDVEIATYRAKEARSTLTLKFSEARYGADGQASLVPKSREALVDALVAGESGAIADAICALEFVHLGVKTTEDAEPGTPGTPGTLTASEEAILRNTATVSGQPFEELRKTFLEVKAEGAALKAK